MKNAQPVVAVCDTHADTERVVRELQESGFDMRKFSVVGRDVRGVDDAVGYYRTADGDRMMHWGTMGAFWDGLWTISSGSAFFVVPGLGPVLVAGPLVSALAEVPPGSADGLGVLGAGLQALGVPKSGVAYCEEALKGEKLVLIAQGGLEDAARVRRVLGAVLAQPA